MARLIVVAEATWGAIYLKPESQSGKANVIIAVSVTNADGVAVTGLSTGNFDVHFMPAPGYNPKFLQAFTIPVEEQVPGIYVLALAPPACPDVGERYLYSISVTSKSKSATDHGQAVTSFDLPAGV